MKRVLFVLLLAICTLRASAYDFTAVCPSGQTLYYTIRDARQHTVAVVAPYESPYGQFPPYEGFIKPEGAIELSETVQYDGTNYTLVEIGPYAFSYLESDVYGDIVIPNTVTLIGTQAFANSYFDGTITLGDHVVTIGELAFRGTHCHGSLVLPSSVRVLENKAFYENENLDGELILNEGLQSIGNHAFYRCILLHGELRLPSTITKLDEGCFYCCSGFTGNLVIPEGIKVIPSYAFRHCSGLKRITFHDNLTTIGGYAFDYCSGLSDTLTLPSNITRVGPDAFAYCTSIPYVNLPNTFSKFEPGCFHGCTSITGNIIIPQGTTCIPERSFLGCINISVSNITTSSVRVHCAPNEHTVVFHDMLITRDAFDNYGADTVRAMLLSDPYPHYEAYDWDWLQLDSATDYYSVAIGQNVDSVWGDLSIFPFRTLGDLSVVVPPDAVTLFSLCPNPAVHAQPIVLNARCAGLLQLFDLSGRQLLSLHVSSGTSSLTLPSTLLPGVYTLRLVPSSATLLPYATTLLLR